VAKKTPSIEKQWTVDDLCLLKQLAAAHTPIALIAEKLGRSEDSVKCKASSINLSLKTSDS